MRALALYLVLALPTAALIQTGWGRAAAAACLVALALALGALRRLWPRLRPRLAPHAPRLLVLALAVLAGVLALLYPLLDRGGPRGGSDGDEALVLGATALVRGEYPYAQRTYLGNPISPMPGTLFMALPVALNDAVPALGWLWVAALAAVVAARHGAMRALEGLGAALLLSPAALHSLATGSDYLANSIAVLLMALALLGWRGGGPSRALAALLLGLMLASRANFWLLLPLLFVALAQRRGLTAAAREGALIAVGLAATVLPFYLADPARFSPLTTAGKLSFLAPEQPWLPLLIVGIGALVAVLWARRRPLTPTRFAACGALLLLLPVLVGMALLSARLGGWDLRYGGYALFALPWGLMALGAPTASWSSSARAGSAGDTGAAGGGGPT